MQNESDVHIFWDFETARVKSQVSGYQVARGLRQVACSYGQIKSFRAYLDVGSQVHSRFPSLRREMHSSGVSIIDCPSASGKDVADKAIIVDMLSLAMDGDPPCTILIATGDDDLAYPLAVMRLRKFKIVLVHPTSTKESLLMQSDDDLNWDQRILGLDQVGDTAPSPSSSSSSPASHPPTVLSNSSNRYPSGFNPYHSAGSASAGSNPGASGQHHSRPSQPLARSIGVGDSGRESKQHVATLTTPIQSPLTISPVLPGGGSIRISASSNAVESVARPTTLIGLTQEKTFEKTFESTITPKRARSGTISTSGDWFFPPPPSFPLDSSQPRMETLSPHNSPKQADNSTQPQSSPSSDGFAIVEPSLTNSPKQSPLLGSFQPPPVNRLSSAGETVITNTGQPTQSNLMTSHDPTTSVSLAHPAQKSISVSTPPVPAPPLSLSGSPHTASRESQQVNSTPPFKGPNQTVKSAPSLPLPSDNPLPQLSTKTPSSSKVTPVNNGGVPRSVPLIYHPLVRILQDYRRNGHIRVNGGMVASKIVKINPSVYANARVGKWAKYILKAVEDGIVLKNGDVISLKDDWLDVTVD